MDGLGGKRIRLGQAQVERHVNCCTVTCGRAHAWPSVRRIFPEQHLGEGAYLWMPDY